MHSWIGLCLTLYIVVIGVTGSILVFRVELERLAGRRPWPVKVSGQPRIRIEQALGILQSAYPGGRIASITVPSDDEPQYVVTCFGRTGRTVVGVDGETGALQRRPEPSWLDFVARLHATLLAGINGRITNGAGGALLLVTNLSGLVIWWPGSKLWRRGLVIDWRRNWRRINFDLHRALGFWALTIISLWGLSGIYFGWPAQVFNLVNRLSPIVSARPPVVQARAVASYVKPDLAKMIATASALDPKTTLSGVSFPYSRRAPFEVLMRRPGGSGREYTDVLYFNPWDGTYLKTWRYGVNESWGDWFIWVQVPLHFGTYWGLGFKVLWALLGLTAPLLAITGAVMYWNRYLRHVRIT